MGKRRVEALREQFGQQGFVEFGTNPVKVALHLLLYLAIGAMLIAIGIPFGPIGIVVMALLAAFVLIGVGRGMQEQAFGPGPALRFDRNGITLRRRGGPVTVAWADDPTVDLTSNNAYGWFPQVQLRLMGEAWRAHRMRYAGPVWLDKAFGRTPYGPVTLLKILDASAKDVVALADADFLDSIGIVAEGQRLLRDYQRNPDDPAFEPSPALAAIKDDVLALTARRRDLEERARKQKRDLNAEERAELERAEAAIAERYVELSEEDG